MDMDQNEKTGEAGQEEFEPVKPGKYENIRIERWPAIIRMVVSGSTLADIRNEFELTAGQWRELRGNKKFAGMLRKSQKKADDKATRYVEKAQAMMLEKVEEAADTLSGLMASESDGMKFKAAKALLERSLGKPVQQVKHSGGLTLDLPKEILTLLSEAINDVSNDVQCNDGITEH